MESFAVDQDLRSELTSGERLLWSGRPPQGIIFRPSDVLMIPFSIMWAGFAFLWEYEVVTEGAPFFFMLWGIPFVLMGVYMVIGRFFWDSRIRSMTSYGVTDRRILIVSQTLKRNVNSVSLRTLPDISFSARGADGGTITLGRANPFSWGVVGWPGYRQYEVPSLELANGARQVYELILRAQHEARPEPQGSGGVDASPRLTPEEADSFDNW